METTELTSQRIKAYLDEGKRFDGRKPTEFREIIIETGVSANAEGSAKVKIGNTEVLVGVKMDKAEPYADSPDEGNIMVSAELLPISSPRYELGPPSYTAVELGRIIDKSIRESKAIDLKKLCIKEGEKVWTLCVDIYSINDDGNLLDAAGIGAVAAIKNARMLKYDEENKKVLYEEITDKKIPLKGEFPLSLTIHKIGNHFLVDPTKEEEDLSETRITFGIKDGSICSVQKANSASMTLEDFEKSLDMADKVSKEISKKIEKHLK